MYLSTSTGADGRCFAPRAAPSPALHPAAGAPRPGGHTRAAPVTAPGRWEQAACCGMRWKLPDPSSCNAFLPWAEFLVVFFFFFLLLKKCSGSVCTTLKKKKKCLSLYSYLSIKFLSLETWEYFQFRCCLTSEHLIRSYRCPQSTPSIGR